ncbi:hypothetical protein [Paracandidimonas soli]|uniref:hypothetical protein n=1 Tax=Paracandidimonas soli TaxID=1917182 RepID=UPI00333FF7F8
MKEYKWLNRNGSWIYVDIQGVIQGRIDKISDDDALMSRYWWQTTKETNCESSLRMAKSLVEHVVQKHPKLQTGHKWPVDILFN